MISSSAAAKLAIIFDLLDTNVYDEDGNIIGQKEPMISKEEAIKLLNTE